MIDDTDEAFAVHGFVALICFAFGFSILGLPHRIERRMQRGRWPTARPI